jgi:hypothetical protein
VANALVCKTSIHGFKSHPVLQESSTYKFAWEFRYYVEADGKRTAKSQYFDGGIYKTATSVRQKIEAQLLQLNEGTEYARTNDVSFNALLERYIAEKMPERHATKGGYTSIINTHLRPKWGSHMVSDTRPAQIHKMVPIA